MTSLRRYLGRHHIALLALFVALGGTSYAAAKLPRNSVGTKQLKRNAVISKKVKDRSLLPADFKAGQLLAGLPGLRGGAGPQGAAGSQGPKGEPTYAKTVFVGPVGTPTQNGAALQSALASLPAHPTVPYLIKVEPGIYDLASTPLQLKSNTSLEGSGENETVIKSAILASDKATVIPAPASRISYVGIENTPVGTSSYSQGILVAGNSPAWVSHVRVKVTGGISSFGVVIEGNSSVIDHADITAGSPGSTGSRGVWATTDAILHTPHPEIRWSSIKAAGASINVGVVLVNGTLSAQWSSISGTTQAVSASSSGVVKIGQSLIDGGMIASSGGDVICQYAFDSNYAPIASC